MIVGVKMLKWSRLLVAWAVLGGPVLVAHVSAEPLSANDWQQLAEKAALLDDSGLMPSLLPTIMRNRDALQLSDEQVKAFRAWRKDNYSHMVAVMNDIIERKVQFRIESLSPGVSGHDLFVLQTEIHALQRQLLEIKLSCRQLVMSTFTEEQWDHFAFVVSENPKLASLFSQVEGAHSKEFP